MNDTDVVPESEDIPIGRQILGSFAHPLAVFCVLGWLLNDHLLKARVGNVVTGKLSDVFGLVVFPLVVAALVPLSTRRRIEVGLSATTALFVSINTSSMADSATERILGTVLPDVALTADPTDLLTLPALAVAWWLWVNPIEFGGRAVAIVGRAAFGLAVASTLATSSAETASAPAISRVEANVDGFFALHQELLLEGYAPYDIADGDATPDGYEHVVYQSEDGETWQISRFAPDSVAWARQFEGCLGATCWSISGADSGRIHDIEGRLVFSPEEQPPDCHVSRWRLPGDCGGQRGVAGPLDLAIDSARGRAVAALGTEGIAVWDGTRWSQVNIDTPRPRGFWERHRSTLVLAMLFIISLSPLAFMARRGRVRRRRAQMPGQRT